MEALIAPIRCALAACGELPEEEVRVEQPRDPKLGDFAFPCFPLAKRLKKAPPRIAEELREAVAAALPGVAVEAAGPYLNFRYEPATLADTILSAVEAGAERYGGSDEGAGKTIVIDLSSPNIAKPMHVGHLRSTIIGAAIQRLHDLLGYRTVGVNHIGDWGSQFGKLVVAIERWGDTVDLEDEPIPALLALYVRFHREAEEDESLEEAARAAFRELESGEEGPVRERWRQLTQLSLREFQRVYDRLGVRFDLVRGEAYYEPYLDATVDRVVETGITEESEGALIVTLDEVREGMAPCLLRKTDGTTLYATRDLAAAFSRWDEFAFDRCLYCVGSDQILHFEQLRGVLRRMGLDWEGRIEHVPFGMMKLPGGKMKTREGRVVFLEDVLDRAVDEATRIITDKNPDLPDLGEVAEQVGVGAIVFNDLKRERVRDVTFQWEEVLTFEGETGPYVQYSHARLTSIERKAAERGEGGGEPDLAALEDARHLLLALGRFPSVVHSAAARCEPSEVSQYLLSLCRDLNSWYAQHRVLGEDPPVTAARLRLVSAARRVVANGLGLLGVAAPRSM